MRKILLLLPLLLAVFSCTEDRDIDSGGAISPLDPAYKLVHYWNFNDDATDDALIAPTHTEGGGKLAYAGSYFDSVDEGTDLNARNSDEAGKALRLRNPSGDFIMTLPTTGYKDVVLTFATVRTSNGPQEQDLTYTLDGVNYVTAGLKDTQIGVGTEFVAHQYDFSDIPGADNNANFKIKIAFAINADLDSGNSRFDNITLDGKPADGSAGGGGGDGTTPGTSKLFHYWNFNDTTSTATLITPVTGNGSIAYLGSYYDAVAEPSDLNARNGDAGGNALRLRNPSGDLILTLPTTGYSNVVIKYAANRTGSGSQTQTVSYTTNGTDYSTTGITSKYTIDQTFGLIEIDFSAIPAVNNNPKFKVKISFDTPSSTATSGNDRIDNLTADGVPL